MTQALTRFASCGHSALQHWVRNPLCANQTLLQRIAHVGLPLFAVLAAGFAIYRTFFYSRSKEIQSQPLIEQGIEQHEEALAFARDLLKNQKEIPLINFWARDSSNTAQTHQPLNEEITNLWTLLHHNCYYNRLVQAAEKNFKNPEIWENKEFCEAADACMKIGYAISYLTLQELPRFKEHLAKQKIERSYAEILTKQDSYQYITFFAGSRIYHELRKGKIYSYQIVPSLLFYKPGTIQARWNILHNEFCDMVLSCVPEKELDATDSRFVRWSKKDLPLNSYDPGPRP